MSLVIDTTAVVAVILNEPTRMQLLKLTAGHDLLAPASMPWEIGNAFSSMFKQGRLTEQQALAALQLYDQMSLILKPVSLGNAVRLSAQLRIYAYDAYMIECAISAAARLVTLDRGLAYAARRAGVVVEEVRA